MTSENIRKNVDKLPAVSVIVPVYNVEPWLARCLDSLLEQTIKNIEIICVDDKSTDGSLKILWEYEKKDSRIKVITQEKNSGVSVARNAGLVIATGEYIGFVDPDDFIDSDFYEKLYGCATLTNADIIKGEMFVVNYSGKKMLFGPSLIDINKNKANLYYAFTSAIYKHSFIIENKLDFPVGIITSEDVVFLTKAVFSANKIELVKNTYYHYIRQEGSADSRFLSIEKLKSAVEAANIIANFINDKITDYREVYNLAFAIRLRYLLYSCIKSYSFDGCMITVRGAIELYKKCKHKGDLDKMLVGNHAKLLSEENEIALLTDLLKRSEKTTRFKLFSFIPLLKIIFRYNTTEIILFRWIPLLRILNEYGTDHYYLFFCIPIIKKTTK